MEIRENVENKSIHSVQSVPIFSSPAEATENQEHEGTRRKISKNRRVSFANSTQYLEPVNPFNTLAPISSSKELSSLYRESCEKHNTRPITSIVQQLEESQNYLEPSPARTEVLNLRHETLSHESCEALEELFKRIKYRAIDLTSCSLDDVSATAIFDMIEYYEACNELDISENSNIKTRGWQSCINMIKRSQALHSLFTRGTPLSDANGGALQKNKVLKELCLANNELNHNDAFHIGSVLKNNFHLQLLDISNNDIEDEGFRHIAEALGYQSVHVDKTSSGDSLLSASKFDFSDLTANLNNINNNRNRFCQTPPPKIHVADGVANNSILQCDNDEKSEGAKLVESEPTAAVAMMSTKSAKADEDSLKDKFKYTTASLSPISHGYDDSTINHQIFNARSPERSFSSESLCSETSIESNDSKSSIRLIETKFNNRNGTLERQLSSMVATTGLGEKPPSGLQVLILWNNHLTPKCSASAADLLETSEHLQIINFGQNPIGNEFLFEVKSSLKCNKSLTSLGLQATQMTCDGLKVLGEALQFGGNSTLQRIDLRNNNIALVGLNALSETLRTNKNIIRIDLDETPKTNTFDNCSEYHRLISTIRQQCAHNENPPEPPHEEKTTTAVEKIKRNHFSTRKISLTCQSVQVIPKQLLEPIIKKTTSYSGRLQSPSPISSPIASPLPSPSRNRFLVSRVSESSSGVSSKLASSTSPSPSSSTGSPTFFPTNPRFKIVTVPDEVSKKFQVSTVVSQPEPMKKNETEKSKEIDIPTKTSTSSAAKFTVPNAFLNISDSSLLPSQSCEQLDLEVKSFIDMDSCSSFSSSMDSVDQQNEMSSTESFDLIDKSPLIVEPLKIIEPEDEKKDILSNENTLISTSSSSSSNEGLTLTTNSPTSELSPKHVDAQKRVRKTSWIQSAIGASGKSENYPATLDKLLNLFHHPSSLFTKTSPESTLSSSPTGKPRLTQCKDEKPLSKENSFSGFFNSMLSLTQTKKEDRLQASGSSTILQNISPENSIGKTSTNPQMVLDALPKSVKVEFKENISPENTISSENLAELEKHSKVLFVVGEGSIDIPDPSEESSATCEEFLFEGDEDESGSSLGDITRDSMSIIKARTNQNEDKSLAGGPNSSQQ